MITLPVAILNHGNTVKFTEYSFLANIFAAAAISRSASSMICRPIRRCDEVGELYVGRLPQYQRGIANIRLRR